MLDLEFSQVSDAGLQRESNEDSLGFFEPPVSDDDGPGWLFALADGVGGHERGEVASRMAIEAMVSGFKNTNPTESLTYVVPKLMQAANASVYEAASSNAKNSHRMATTLVACALRHDRAVIAHAGDSRCYLIREGRAACLTRDHTVASSNILTRAVGIEMFLNVETSEHQIFAGDLLVLCSDGLHHSVEGTDMLKLAGGSDPLEAAAQAMVELAKARDGSDNISVQLIRIRSVERVGLYRGRPYKLP